MKPLAITGIGVCSPFGIGYQDFVAGLNNPDQARKTSFAKPTSAVFADGRFEAATVAEIKGFDPNKYLGDKGHRNLDRLTRFLIVAGKHALEDAGLKAEGKFISTLKPNEIGVASSTAYGSLDSITELNLVAELEDPRYINPARFPNTVINAAAGYVSIWEDLQAPNATIVDGNCGALDAVLTCETHLMHQRGHAFLVGGGDVLSEPLYVAFQKLGALAESDAICSPGSEHSVGLHLGEGAAYLNVEREADAVARGARIRAAIAGYGTAFEAPTHEALLINPTPIAIGRAIRLALDDAGIKPESVDLVCSSLSGLPRFDAAELHGLQQVFGDRVAIAAPKALWGESFAGSPALSMAASVAWLEGAANPTVLEGKLDRAPENIVVTAMGYYGNATAVVLRKR